VERMKVQVLHATNPVFSEEKANEYKKVAEVEVKTDSVDEALEYAFGMTNHIDRPWWENKCVTVVGEKNHRSTSVGDMAVVDGTEYICEMLGFKKVS
jgi:hypothetical protein